MSASDFLTPLASKVRAVLLRALPVWILPVLAGAVPVFGQASFGSLPVGQSAQQSVTVTATLAGQVSSLAVLTLGAKNQDYTDAGGSCTTASFPASGQTCVEQIGFTPKFPGSRPGAVVLLDGNRNTLGVAMLQGVGSAGLAVFSTGNVATFAGNGSWTSVGDGGTALHASFDLPSSVVFDGQGNAYIADSMHNRIRMVSSGAGETINGSVPYPQAGYVTTIAGNGTAGFAGDNGPADAPGVMLNSPGGIAIDGAGNLYIADTINNVVRKITAANGIISTIAGNGVAGSSGDNGPATAASLDAPWGVTPDGNGNIYIADTFNHQIRAICAAASVTLYGVTCTSPGEIIVVAGTGMKNPDGSGGWSGDNGQAVAAQLNYPYPVGFDAQQNMYIPDSANNRVRLVKPLGTISTFAGNGTPAFRGDGQLATLAELQTPSAVAVDPAQNVYISDTQNSAIRKVSASTSLISTVTRGGVGQSVKNNTIYSNYLYGPKGITLDPYGNLYVADYYNMRIAQVQANLALINLTSTPTTIGDTSSPGEQTVENDGNADLTLTSLTPDANSAIVSPATTCLSSSPLTVDEQCVIEAEFVPTAPGNPLLAKITVDGQTDDSPLVLVVAGDAPSINSTTINVSSSQNPSNFGQLVTITATVATGAGTGALTGTLTYYDGATVLQSGVVLNSVGTGTYSTSTLSVGSHVITAAYSGDSKHNPSTSSPFTQVVNENTAVGLAASPNPAALGSAVTFTATVTIAGGGGVTPDGQVAFLDGANLLNTVTINASGVASLTTSQLTQGAHSITAVYGGDPAKFINGSTSPVVNLEVVSSTTAILSSTPNPSTYGNSVSFTAKLTFSGTGTPTGSVNFFDGTQQIGTQALAAGANSVTFNTANLAVGSHTVTASYAGDQYFGPSTSNGITQVVNVTQTTTTIKASPAPAVAGTLVTLTAAIATSSGIGTVTGTVTFADGATILGSPQVGANGVATISLAFSPGTHSLIATYGGDQNDKGSTSATLGLVVTAATTQTSLISSASPAQVLSPVTFSATVSGNGVTPTGSLTFKVDGIAVNTAPLDANGAASFTDSSLPVGSHTILASYSGDLNDAASNSSSLSETITAIPTSTNLTMSSVGGNTPQTVLISTTLSSSGPVPTGTVTFASAGNVIGTASLDSSGVATIVPALPAGTYSVIATYGGDALHAPSTSASVQISGTAANFTVGISPGTMNLPSGQSGTVSVAVSSVSGFSDSIQMGCLGLPNLVNCHFSSDSFSLQSGQTQTLTLRIDTDAPIGGGLSASNSRPGANRSIRAAALAPLGLYFGWILFARRRKKGNLILSLLTMLSLSMVLGGCGTGISQSSAAAGTYTIQIGGSGSTSKVSNYQTLTLTITK